MLHRSTIARRVSVIVVSAAIAFTGVACGNDDGDSSLPPERTTVPDGAATTGDTEGTPGKDPGSDDLLAPFADIDEAEMNAYCDAVQTAVPLDMEKARVIAESSPAPIKAEFDRWAAGMEEGADKATQDAAWKALERMTALHEDVCGIPVVFG